MQNLCGQIFSKKSFFPPIEIECEVLQQLCVQQLLFPTIKNKNKKKHNYFSKLDMLAYKMCYYYSDHQYHDIYLRKCILELFHDVHCLCSTLAPHGIMLNKIENDKSVTIGPIYLLIYLSFI